MTSDTLTAGQIFSGLRRLGIRPGDRVFVHASLSRFGHVEGGAAAVADALLEAIGPRGTLLIPAFTFANAKIDQPLLDILNSPSGMGAIAEELRRRAGRHRSVHLTHSVAAIGADARDFTASHSLSPCGEASPFWKLIERGGALLLLGVSLNSATLFHAIEERLRLPYKGFRDLHGQVRDADGATWPLDCQCANSSEPYDFNTVADALADARILTKVIIGASICRRIDASALWGYLRPRLEADPGLLTMKTEDRLGIPVTVDGQLA